MIIYEIVCNITGERYIGSTKNTLKQRIHSHTYGARSNNPRSNYKSKQIIVRGDYQENILEEGDFGKEREQYYIETLPNINDTYAFGINKQRSKDRHRIMKRYIRSWGDDRRHNNLLRISMDLFH